ncbi:copper chaperone PCu(A)C [Polaromonas sp.]|uniref:copper chaperone PCu(A)C n=1 Tax=Polaromonas sp. TaxID=1869339 RepID=UPI003FA6C268
MKLNVLITAALAALSALCVAGTSAHAQTIEVKDAWIRTSVQGQKGTGAFMKITAKEGAKLVGGSTPVAGVAEVHEMKMDGDVMRMRAVPVLDLPAGKTVELKPGGYHLMLMDLKQPLAKDSTVPLTLVFKNAKGVESKVELKVPVSAVAPGAGAAAGKAADKAHSGHGEHKH